MKRTALNERNYYVQVFLTVSTFKSKLGLTPIQKPVARSGRKSNH